MVNCSVVRSRRLCHRVLLATLCSFAFGLAAASAEAPTDNGAQAQIDKMMTALGGRETISQLRSLAAEADCEGPDGTFLTRVESLRPDAVYFQQRDDDHSTAIWSTDDRTWRDSESGPQDLSDSVRSFVRGHEFHLLILELETRFSHHRLGATDSTLGTPCQRLDMEDSAGQPASICVGKSEGLPINLELNPPEAQGPIRIRFDDWKEVQGIRYFHSFVLTEGPDRTFTYQYRTLEPNAVAADRFVVPTSRALQEQQDALLEILRSDRQAHLTTDASMISSHVADSLVEVYAGELRSLSRAEVESSFRAQFEGATYELWEDLEPPIIRISADATMAWVVRKVGVRRRAPDATGTAVSQEFTSAYTATYEKQAGGWRMTSVTSTFLPT